MRYLSPFAPPRATRLPLVEVANCHVVDEALLPPDRQIFSPLRFHKYKSYIWSDLIKKIGWQSATPLILNDALDSELQVANRPCSAFFVFVENTKRFFLINICSISLFLSKVVSPMTWALIVPSGCFPVGRDAAETGPRSSELDRTRLYMPQNFDRWTWNSIAPWRPQKGSLESQRDPRKQSPPRWAPTTTAGFSNYSTIADKNVLF